MTEGELAEVLREAYHRAPVGQKTEVVQLFGIWYVNELCSRAVSIREVCEIAGIPRLGPMINTGKNLARYVTLNEHGERFAAWLGFEQ